MGQSYAQMTMGGGMPPCPEGDMECMEGMHHDGGPNDMGCPPPGMPDHDECMKGMHHDGGPNDMSCPPPGMPDHDECMKGMHHDGGSQGDMGPPPAVHECFENGGSPEECCGLMGDEHGKEMCLKHSQEGPDPHGDMGNQSMMCDPGMDYPQADPAPNGCGNYTDCNDNGAYDLGEPCAEHD